ncbi:YHS domain protein [Anaerohalosphaera lusitana]|uniref:YHS domain protein n=1 Tax=Anaerohalosphaera lusitana TaxID=1936003 RepID=A0A1U9NNI4_9BACT|nr:YHS domain-containing protein [Anaerohalosphaera lusitana]AQT69481.1 YHS domain protein [Anaerohalosphaera lusitana]
MRNLAIVICVLVVGSFVVIGLSGCGENGGESAPVENEQMDHENHEGHDHEAMEEESEAGSEETAQKICPIMGNEIDKGISTEYKGKTVYFCCPGCIDTFEENPEKYVDELPQFQG